MKLSGIKVELSPVQLVGRYERLRNDNMYKDVTLTAHDNVVSAHKCILSISSQFFELLFQQAERKRDLFHRSSFELVGLGVEDASMLDAVIDFLYSGIIYINDINFMGIMKLADYLAIDELLDLGEKYLEQNLSKENCLKLYLDMKKSLNGEASKGTSHQGRRINELVKLTWEIVETNFYDHIIDNHDFLEVIPEEVENLLQKNFNMEKVLDLAVRWMKTWPLGFIFAESLINIAHSKLDTAANLEQTEKSKAHIVKALETIRDMVSSRTVPKCNSKNMLKRLKEVQRLFDENYVESENGDNNEEIDMEEDDNGKKTDNVEKEEDFEGKNEQQSEGVINKGKFKEIIDQEITFECNSECKQDVQSMEYSESENAMADCVFETAENASEVDVEQQEMKDQEEEKEIDQSKHQSTVADEEKTPDSILDIDESKKESNEASLDIYKLEVSVSGNRTEGNSDSNSVQGNSVEVEKIINGVESAGEELKVEENCMDVLGTVVLMENKKIDGTEQEIPHSDSVAELTIQERVTECLELMVKTVKTEQEEDASEVTGTKSVHGRRGRGRPKKYFNAVQEENLKLKIKTRRSKTRGTKRKASNIYAGMSGSELDEPAVKVETHEVDVEESENDNIDKERTDVTAADEDKDSEGDSEDEVDEENDVYVSDKVFEEILKQTLGNEVNDSGLSKKLRKRKPRKPGHHECAVCNKVYSQKYRLNQHMNKHMGIKPYKCVVCLQCFTRTDHVVRHMKSQHVDIKVFKCDECNEEFDKPNEMVSHSITHFQREEIDEKINAPLTEAEKEYIEVLSQDTGKPEYKCIKCSQTFKKQDPAREHVYFHTGEKPYKCEQCDTTFSKKENLGTHVRHVHDGKRGEHKCSKCRRLFIKKENYEAHIEKCEPTHKCEHCPLKFYRKTHLDNHTPVHDITPQHKCPQCDNAYRYRKHLLRHIRKDHLNEKEKQSPCICDTCGVVVKNKEALYRHKKTHKLPDKECDVCGKAFKDNTTLKDHKLMHTNIRDYQCEICSMLFARKGNLVRHQKRHRGERKYRCEMCGMCFVANCDLTRHKNTHLGVKKFPCRYCGRKFGLRSKVVVHERTHTGERPYFCREENCGKTFKQTGDRVRHEKKVHNLTFNKYMTLYELATGEAEDIYKGAEPPSKAIPVPVTTSVEVVPNNSVITIAPAMGSGMAAEYSQNPELDSSYMEDAEKIFERTVAALSQDAIANSGIYN